MELSAQGKDWRLAVHRLRSYDQVRDGEVDHQVVDAVLVDIPHVPVVGRDGLIEAEAGNIDAGHVQYCRAWDYNGQHVLAAGIQLARLNSDSIFAVWPAITPLNDVRIAGRLVFSQIGGDRIGIDRQ